MSPELFRQDGMPIPYIATWTREILTTAAPVVAQQGPHGWYLAYTDEGHRERDAGGALLRRQGLARGRGRAYPAEVHVWRQQQCMRDLLCQVCAAPTQALREDERSLFLVAGSQPITEGEVTDAPPVCEPCAAEALRWCPHLRRSATAAFVNFAPAWGVAGLEYDPRTLRPRRQRLTRIPYGDPRLRWTIAHRHVISLKDVTPVPVKTLATA